MSRPVHFQQQKLMKVIIHVYYLDAFTGRSLFMTQRQYRWGDKKYVSNFLVFGFGHGVWLRLAENEVSEIFVGSFFIGQNL
jgi:hypothetical protein